MKHIPNKCELWDAEGDCQNCGQSDEELWFLHCCGKIMCGTCKENHDAKFSTPISDEDYAKLTPMQLDELADDQ